MFSRVILLDDNFIFVEKRKRLQHMFFIVAKNEKMIRKPFKDKNAEVFRKNFIINYGKNNIGGNACGILVFGVFELGV